MGFMLLLSANLLLAMSNGGSGSTPISSTSFLDAAVPSVVQNCMNLTISGIVRNASNPSQQMPSTNVTFIINATTNATFTASATGFSGNISAPCLANGLLANLTILTNRSHNKTFPYFVSNATNVSVTVLSQKPPFALNTNNTINLSYFNGSTALVGNKPTLKVFRTDGREELVNVRLYNLSASTNAQGIIQYNISVGPAASGIYFAVTDNGLNVFSFTVQSAYSLSFLAQDLDGATRSSFPLYNGINTTGIINLIGKTRYANGTSYDLVSGDYVTAFITLPNQTVQSLNLSALGATTSPGINNRTFRGVLAGSYFVQLVGIIQNNRYESNGFFDVKSTEARLELGSDFFKRGGRQNVALPGSVVRFNLLAINTSSGRFLSGFLNPMPGEINCSSLKLNSITNVLTNANTSWTGSAVMGENQYPDPDSICTLTVGIPSASGDYRFNSTFTDPENDTRTLTALGLVSVRSFGLNLFACPSTSSFVDCGPEPFFLKGRNASFEYSLQNFSSGMALDRSSLTNVAKIALRPLTLSGGLTTEITNWTLNTNFYNQTTQTSTTRNRLLITLPSTLNTGPAELELTVNTPYGPFTSREFFFIKSTSVQAFGGPFTGMGQFRPETNCNGNVTFFIYASDLNTRANLQGVKIQGVKTAQTFLGRTLDSTFITGITTNTTDTSGQATFNVTLNGSKNVTGFVAMILNITYQGVEDEAFAGFMCGSGTFDSVPNSRGGDAGGFGGTGPGGSSQNGIIYRNSFARSVVSPNQPITLTFTSLSFSSQTPVNGMLPGINGTLRVTALRVMNPATGTQASYNSNGTLRVNVTNGEPTVGQFFGLTLQPSNFSLPSWPIGMTELVVNLTNGSTVGNEAGPSAIGRLPGFEVAPFRIRIDRRDNFGGMTDDLGQLFVGSNVSFLVNVSSNVSIVGKNVTVRMRPMSGTEEPSAYLVSSVMLIDGWNSSINECCGAEQWNVTFTVPQLPSGNSQVVFSVNNSQGIVHEYRAYANLASFVVKPVRQSIVLMSAQCDPLEGIGENGSVQACFGMSGPGYQLPPASLILRLNFSTLNSTYSVFSKSNRLCYKESINYTSAQGGMATILDKGATAVAVIDNRTAGVYDTVVFNNTDGNLTIMTMSNLSSQNRHFGRFNTTYNEFYVIQPAGCPRLMITNSSDESGNTYFADLGEFPVNMPVYVLYRVLRGNPINLAGVDFAGFSNMTFGTFGFNNMLPASSSVTRSGTTDVRGIAALELNMTVAGDFMAFWKANATIGGVLVQEFAKMQRDEKSFGGGGGHFLHARTFIASCNFGMDGPSNQVKITSPDQNFSVTCSANAFNGTPLNGVDFAIYSMDTSTMNPTRVLLRLHNATSGAVVINQTTDSTGMVPINFTRNGGWQQGRFYQLLAQATTSGGSSQDAFMPGASYTQGESGGVGDGGQ